MHKLMIVEDDQTISRKLKENLQQWDYEVVVAEDFASVLSFFVQEKPQMVLLDITLPFFNGYYWCQEIRKISTVPILFLSSHDQSMDIVMAINMGADDYITKPFDMNVLLAKIQGILRRSYEFSSEQAVLDYQGVILDLKAMEVHFQGQTLQLTKNEFQILRVLFERNKTIVSRNQLMQELWNSDLFIDDNTLTVNVARLRKKLQDINLGNLIVTKKGIGYGLGQFE